MSLHPSLRRLARVLIVLVAVAPASGQVVLPGTRPGEHNLTLETVEQCAACHGQTASGRYDPHASWQTGLMSLASKDPVFRAAMAIANQDIPGVGEFCLRCHSPRGFFAGRALSADGSALLPDDLQGVSCATCHRLVDPRTPEAGWLSRSVPPGLGNGMMVLDPAYVMRGPYGDDPKLRMRPHQARQSAFVMSGDLCGTCHDVSNPTHADDVTKQPPHTYSPIERTYSEWRLSDFAKRGRAGACQACHYPPVAGGGYPSRFRENPKREPFAEHGPVGGSTWVQEAIWRLWDGRDMDRAALDRGREKARRLLRTAAKLDVSFPEAGRVRVRVTNLSGHKLPTGYPEGRRMWLQTRFLDGDGKPLEERGRYGEQEDTVAGRPARYPTLLDPERARVYECLPAMSDAQAKKYGKTPGPSFFFVLNDVIAKDNRIPPKGFVNEALASHQCEPVGATYADGQHWDDVDLDLPPGTARVEVRLLYQSVSAEYMKFLVEENRTDEWGRRLYDIWTKTDFCPPEVIAEATARVEAGIS